MRTQPQTELPLAAPVSPKINHEHASRSSSRREEPSFATTLDQSTKPQPVESSTKPIQESDQTNTTNIATADSPKAEKTAAPPQPDNHVDQNEDGTLPNSPLIIPDASIPELLAPVLISDPTAIAPLLQALIAEPKNNIPFATDDAALPTLADIDLTLPVTLAPVEKDNDAIINYLFPSADPTHAQALTSPTPILISVADQLNTNATITSAAATPLTPTKATSPTPVSQQAKSSIKAEALSTVAPEGAIETDVAAALPPIQGNQHVDDKEISKPMLGKLMAKEDAPTTIPLPTTPASQATPSTQTSDFHAIAKSLAASDTKIIPDNKVEATTTQSRPLTEVTALPPVQPTTTPATKITSEAVNAQPLLAQNGNAMEKAVTHQIQRALVQHLPTGERMMVLRMTPPELGTVRIEVIERNGVLSARLHAEDDSVRLAIERFLPGMRADLRASDAPIREITLSDQSQFQRSFADGQQQQHQTSQDNSSSQRNSPNGERFSLDGSRLEAPITPRTPALGGHISAASVNAFA